VRKQRFPFLISPYEKPADSLVGRPREDPAPAYPAESSLREVGEAVYALSGMVARILEKLGGSEGPQERESPDLGEEQFYSQLIPVLDGLDSVREAIGASGDESWKKGIDLFHEKLHHLFETRGFRVSSEVGDEFDPSLHEAIGAEISSVVPAGAVSQVVQNGWLLGDRVLRYAKVIVAKREE